MTATAPVTEDLLTQESIEHMCLLLQRTSFLNQTPECDAVGIPYLNTNGIIRAHTVWAFLAIRLYHFLNEYEGFEEEAKNMHGMWNLIANEIYENPIDVAGAEGKYEATHGVLGYICECLRQEENDIVKIYWMTHLLDAVMETTTDYAIAMYKDRGEERWEQAMNICKSLTVGCWEHTKRVRKTLLKY